MGNRASITALLNLSFGRAAAHHFGCRSAIYFILFEAKCFVCPARKPGCSYDNAAMNNLFGALKTE